MGYLESQWRNPQARGARNIKEPAKHRRTEHKKTKKRTTFQRAQTKRDKRAMHKSNTAWSNFKGCWLNVCAQEIKPQHSPQSERGNTSDAGPFRNESQCGTQASDREGQAARLVQRDEEARVKLGNERRQNRECGARRAGDQASRGFRSNQEGVGQ